ncbi:MAG TPA: DNA polymerase III subunit alpha [Planctomycetes bacterium]|nr:DNA polymerase III subunit alpha [Planctomycetota bacterium]HIL51314.1 DNA polymerase III subunit alpha [Planctomycetota bacterium]
MSAPEFVHLHVHSEYSLLDGANRISDLVEACVEDGQGALALTDHGNMFGAIELYQKAKARSVTPIIGCEVYIARQSRHAPHSKKKGNGYNHLTLLARNKTGYENLIRLASLAYIEGYHFRPRIDKELLFQHAEGLNCLSGCLAGEINQLFLTGKEDEAAAAATELRDIFGPEHFWLELQRNGIDDQNTANEALYRLHQKTAIPLIATNDIHYLRAEDCQSQDVLLCINTGAKVADEKRFRFDTDSLFFKTREEMGHMFRDLPKSLAATMDVADQTDVTLEFGNYHLPIFKADSGETSEAIFERLLEEGLERKYGSANTQARERLEYEKRVISELGFVSYFLIVWDLIRWARAQSIPVGPGRGSAAGSMVAYLLDITKVCPLKYGLLFERFLNSARVSMPDIDIDFCKEGRERVMEYTRERYGEDHVAQIVTFGTMASRTVVRDVGRVLDVPLKAVDALAKKIPQGPGSKGLKHSLESDPDLKALLEEPALKELFELSLPLEGLARHMSTHAAGVVIADKPIMNYVPLAKNGDDIVTQWAAPQLEELGLLKMDYLGLRTLTIIDRALGNIAKQGGTPPDLETLRLDDEKTFALLMSGETQGIFQLESEGMRKLIARLKPDCFEDLIAILALYRPGPLESGMAEMFVRRKHGKEEITYPHASLEELLRETYGCIVYQEQVMLISSTLANFSLNEADNLRKAMGKKKPEIMEKFSEQFIEGAMSNGCPRATAKETWDNIVKFGGYGFNKSHSTAYALVSYQTAYIKAHARCAFLAANLSCEMHESDKVKVLLDDARQAGIEVRLPDIEHSDWEFEVEGQSAIRFGFGAIKGTGVKAVRAMVDGRKRLQESGRLISLHNLCEEIDPALVGRAAWEAVIMAGAFDSGGHNRGAVLCALDSAFADGVRAAANRKSGQGDLFGGAPAGPGDTADGVAEAGDGINDAHGFSKGETLKAEFEVLGFYLSGHPLEERAGLIAMLSSGNTAELQEQAGGSKISLAGMLMGYKENQVKSGRFAGQKMARFRLEDLQGSVPVTVFPRTFAECRDKLEDGRVLVVRGKLEDGSEEPAMILEEVLDIEEALARFDGGLVIHLTPADADNLGALKTALEEHRGKQRVYFQVTGDDGNSRRVRAGAEWTVAISQDLARTVDRVLGPGRTGLARV